MSNEKITLWGFLAPLRTVQRIAQKLRHQHSKPQVKFLLRHAALYVSSRPALLCVALALINWFHGLKQRVSSTVSGASMSAEAPHFIPKNLANLTPRARQIHADLKLVLAKQQKEDP